jgi:hypothetical protein
MAQHILRFFRRVGGVKRHEYSADSSYGENRKQELGRVRQDQRNSIAPLYPYSIQSLGDAIYFALKLSVRPAPLFENQRNPVRVARRPIA